MFDDAQQLRVSTDTANRLDVARGRLPRVPHGGCGPSPELSGHILPMAHTTDAPRKDPTPTLPLTTSMSAAKDPS